MKSTVVNSAHNYDNPGLFSYCITFDRLDVMGNNKTIIKLMKLRSYSRTYIWDHTHGWIRI